MTRPLAHVVTHHWVPNFGANLQALATRRALEARGYDVRFVDFRPPELIVRYARTIPPAQQKAHADFVATHLPLTDPVDGQAAFAALAARTPADLYITGSDAVFRVDAGSDRSDLSFPNPYWLTGLPDGARRMAMAPSAMGCDFGAMTDAARAGMTAALGDIGALSARDPWTAGQIAGLGLPAPTLVPDPVFSLRDMVRDMAADRPARPYVVVSTKGRRSRDWIAAFTARAAAAGYDTVALPTPDGTVDAGATRTVDLPLDPLDWVRVIARSSGYVGVRFHPVVISQIVGNPVLALDLYHLDPRDRRRSKTWLMMRDFGNQTACVGRRLHRVVTPGLAWWLLHRQDRARAARLAVGDTFAARIEAFVDAAAGLRTDAR